MLQASQEGGRTAGDAKLENEVRQAQRAIVLLTLENELYERLAKRPKKS